ncbi:zinc finger protein 658-like [Anopheles albimanus]|uniref:Protein krueppel n=1 Tax=Anopheles albimanus TaxID=7167 RepID=A0A1I8JSW8_ANOAL|nr:zinc finger protein 658-like [Anopheles albimanus]
MEVLGEVSSFCRFCLSQDCETLMPLSSVIENLSFSVQDILETTGISILETETAYLAVCTKCSNRIELAVDFRRSCIEGNVKFLQLFGHIIDKLHSVDITEKNLDDTTNLKGDPLEIEIVFQNRLRNEHSLEVHDEPSVPVEESQEMFDERTNFGQDDCVSENSSSEDPPLVATNMLESKRKVANKIVCIPKSSRRTVKSIEQARASKEDNVTKSPKPRQRLCGICGALVYNIIDHTRSHTKENLLQCPHCPVQMANNANLRAHVRAVHEKVVIKSCEPCGKGFTTENAYKSHMRTHHNIGEQYQCEICLKIFNHASSRLLHFKRIHIAEWKYECQICQKKFKDPNTLKLHGRVHSTNAPYACSLCPKRFKSPHAKKTHEITHSGIDFPCTLCSKVYRYKTLLNMHYRKCHPAECSGESA